jgi:Acetyltransferase (GNAT) domain
MGHRGMGCVTYHFRPARQQDLPLFRRWLQTPEVRRWWGDPEEQAALLEADLNEPCMVMRVVSFGHHPFAYAQHYAVHDCRSLISLICPLARGPSTLSLVNLA